MATTYTIVFTSDEIREISNALLSKRLQITSLIDKTDIGLTKSGLISMANKISILELKILNITSV